MDKPLNQHPAGDEDTAALCVVPRHLIADENVEQIKT
jgi:hypothetical protein